MTSRPKLLFVLPSAGGGGAERASVDLLRGIHRQQFQMTLALLTRSGRFLQQLPDDVPVRDLRGRQSYDIRLVWRLAAVLRRENPDVVFSVLRYTNLITLLACRLVNVLSRVLGGAGHRAAVVVNEQNPPSAEFALFGGGRVKGWFLKRLYPGADRVTAISAGISRELVSVYGLSPDKVQVIPNPVDLERVTALAAAKLEHPFYPATPLVLPVLPRTQDAVARTQDAVARARPQLTAPTNGGMSTGAWVQSAVAENALWTPSAADQSGLPVLVAVGRLHQQKGFAHLIRAFSIVRQALPCKLVILGEGPLRPELENLIASLGLTEDIALPGFQENPYNYISNSTAFVLSSLFEGFGNVLVDALALGVPIISTRCPVGPEDIITDGVTGVFVPPADEEALAQAILRVLRDDKLRRRLSANGPPRAADFAIERIVSQYEALFERLSREKSGLEC